MQGEFLAESLKLLKENGYNTCIDTSGYGNEKYFKEILENTDTILLDVKSFSNQGYMEMVKQKIDGFYKFLEYIDKYFNGKIWFRHVMVPGFTDNKESMDKLVEIIEPYKDKIGRVEILPYHVMGVEKYKEIGKEYQLKDVPAMNKEKAAMLESYVRSKLKLI